MRIDFTIKTNNMKVSVIMPVYNAEPFLKESIESILNQTFNNFEVVIIDDGSTDKSGDIIDAFEAKNNKIFGYFRHENKGIANRSNFCMEMSDGDYIAIMGADDIAMPNRLQLQYDYMEAHPECVVCGGAFQMFGAVNKTVKPRNNHLLNLITPQFNNQTTMIRKSFLDEHGIRYNEDLRSYSEDFQMWNDIFKANKYDVSCFHNLPDVLLKYRIHPKQSSKNLKPEDEARNKAIRNESLRAFNSYFASWDFLPYHSKHTKEFKRLLKFYGLTSHKSINPVMAVKGLFSPMTAAQKMKVVLRLVFGRKYKTLF